MTTELTFFGFEREAARFDRWSDCLRQVLAAGALHSSGSPFTEDLEHDFAAWLGRRHVVAVSSGTEALRLGLEVLDLPPGEVLVPAFTFQASVAAIVRCGLTPRFVDISPDTLQVDPAAVRAAVTADTVGILPVHLFGIPAPMTELTAIAEEHGLAVLEDCAQSVGAAVRGRKVGTFGAVAAFSCGPTKPLGGLGEGGLVAVNEPACDAHLRRARHNGALRDFRHELVGANAMMDSLQAAFLGRRLTELDDQLKLRRTAVERYEQRIADVPGVSVVRARPDDLAAPSKFTVLLPDSVDRERLVEVLTGRGVPTNVYYRVPQHRQECFAAYARDPLPVTEHAAAHALSLPLHPYLTDQEVDHIAGEFATAVREVRA